MATMVKEAKRREKKKVKDKSASRISVEREQPSVLNEESIASTSKTLPKPCDSTTETNTEILDAQQSLESSTADLEQQLSTPKESMEPNFTDQSIVIENPNILEKNIDNQTIEANKSNFQTGSGSLKSAEQISHVTQISGKTYHDINSRLERISIPSLDPNLNLEEIQDRLENPQAYMKLDKITETCLESQEHSQSGEQNQEMEYVAPSAPMFEEPELTQYFQQHEETVVREIETKPQCMRLEEAIKLFGGTEMERVRVISEKEEAIVEAGPVCGPEHPLVDLLSTFRSALIAVDRERLQISKGYIDEEKYRSKLWKVEKRRVNASEECSCRATVYASYDYEHAELCAERLPVARLKLDGLLRDVQESYCHHQHAALFAHCQIEEIISETIKSHKKEIREALALVLQALRQSDNAPESLGAALQRWAAALSAALLDNRDVSQLIHLLHHFFRQTRSVRWASRVIRSYVRAGDRSEAAETIALLDLLLARSRLEAAQECIEDADSSWVEMDKSGSGAVSDGSLRERDMLALLCAFPMRDLVARILLFTHNNVRVARAQEWGGGGGGGGGALRACCGARALLRAWRRAGRHHPTYTRLQATLGDIAVNLLHALAGLHLHSRDFYSKDLADKISAELEACFSEGFDLLGGRLVDLPTSLLSDHTAREYCCVNILALHDKSPKQLDFLPITLPVVDCSTRVETVTRMALDRLEDAELARNIMDFLLQTGIKRKSPPVCAGGCGAAARAQLPLLLRAHSYLHTLALHTLAELHQVEPLEPSSMDVLAPLGWRPNTGEARQLLDDWSCRCPQLIQHLLLKLDYTPHSGLSLDTQLTILSWLRAWLRQSAAPPPEWAWLVLRRARPHRSWWGGQHAPPPDPPPSSLFEKACAVLTSDWGHSIPLICSEGVSALCSLAAGRPADAARCLAPLMPVMAHSPESVALTPKFNELFSTLLRWGPTVVQRALGWGPEPGHDLLLRIVLEQIEGDYPGTTRPSLVSAWLHALWTPCLASHALVEVVLLAARDWMLFDNYATQLMQDEKSSEFVSSAVENAWTAPLLCWCVLRARAGAEARGEGGRLLDALHWQRARGEKAHVDNALKEVGSRSRSSELAVYKCGAALLSAPLHSPAHLTLWALFTHLYLQRPPCSMLDSTSPVGPLFFSGFTKSRVLTQLRRKLQETITYHHEETETLKRIPIREAPLPPSRSKPERNVTDDVVLPTLNIKDLLGESSDSSDSETDTSEEAVETGDDSQNKEDTGMLLKYHAAAEKMCKEYLRWLDEADKTRAMPHHADIARFIPEQVLGAAWSRELSTRRPAPSLDDAPPPAAPPPSPPPSPFQATVARILAIRDHSTRRSRRASVKSFLEDVDLRDARSLLKLVDKYLADVTALAEEWRDDVSRLSSLDSALWGLVRRLRVSRPIQPQRKQCRNRCKHVTVYLQGEQWCISSDAERGIEENRRASRALTRRLARPRPHAARSAAALLTIARHASSAETAQRVCERVWAGARVAGLCAPAADTITAVIHLLADRFLSYNGKVCADLITRWGNSESSALQQSLCGALVSPRRLPAPQWPPVYCAVLKSRLPPHIAFSYLSKFEMSRWAEVCAAPQRRELLEALVCKAQGYGLEPDPDCHVLLELVGVHTCALLDALELCAHVTRCAHASAARRLPPTYWAHVTRAANQHAYNVPFDQLGHLLRSLGALWWEARSQLKSQCVQYTMYAAPTAELLAVLTAAFTAAATALSLAAQRVALLVWSALQEAWGPWVAPHHSPLLQSAELHTTMLKKLVRTVLQVMADCPGIEEDLLQRIFEWVVQTYLSAPASQECRAQLTALLEELRALPWARAQWAQSPVLSTALQVLHDTQECRAQLTALLEELRALPWARAQWAQSPVLSTALQVLHDTQECRAQLTALLEELRALPWARAQWAQSPVLSTALQVLHDTQECRAQLTALLEELRALPWARAQWAQSPVLSTALQVLHDTQECRAQLTALLEELRALPWARAQWAQSPVLSTALQACASDKKELQAWCSAAWRGGTPDSWLRGVDQQQLAPLLASLLYLYTAMHQHEQTIEQATRLPWWRLPEPALDEALERYFAQHHNPTTPYHELPQFRVILFASELRIDPSCPPPSVLTHTARNKRGACVSRWTLSACAHALAPHVPAQTRCMLDTLTDIATYLEGSVGEIEELLSRALAVMCMEPAATAALPVWCEWVRACDGPVAGACVSAAGTLTAFEPFAALAEAALRAHCDNRDSGGWGVACQRLSATPWREVGPLASRARLYAAYCIARAHEQTHANMQTAFLALLAADINYIENESIFALWLCVAGRYGLACSVEEQDGSGAGAARGECGAGAARGECGAAARAVLARAAEEPRRNLLKMVTMQADSHAPTARHRLLARLALCVVPGSGSSVRAYQASCAAVLGSSPDALAWAAAPAPTHLPRLAVRLFPDCEAMFKDELDMAAGV